MADDANQQLIYEHIGTLNPDYPHRLKCKRCSSEAGQVLRVGSDVFDCLCCGSFTYIKGVNLNAHRLAESLRSGSADL